MTRLFLLVARRSLRRGPGRAVVVLLLVAVGLPVLLDTSPAVSALVTAAISIAAALGAASTDPGRHPILDRNGASTWDRAVVGAADLAGPAAIACALALPLSHPVWSDGPHPVAVLLVAGVIPVLAGALTAWALSPRPAPRRWVVVLVGVLVALLAPTIVPSLLLAAWLIARLGPGHPVLRTLATVGAVGGAIATALVVGRAESWFDLQWFLLAAAAPLTVAVAWISAQLMGLAAGPLRHLGPIARLAATPLVVRRGHLGPIAAAVGLVATLAAMEGVVGASFGAREDGRARGNVVLGVAGTSPDQHIVVTSNLDAEEARSAAAEAATGREVQVAVIDQLGDGGTETRPDIPPGPVPESRVPDPLPRYDLLSLFEGFLAVPPGVRVTGTSGPSWVGVVTPADLPALGLADAAPALERGEAVVVDPGVDARTTIEVAGPYPHQVRTLPVFRPATTGAPGLLLPAVVVSPAVAEQLGGTRHAARVVVVPASPDPDPAVATHPSAAAADVEDRAREAVLDGAGTVAHGRGSIIRYFETQETPTARGDDELVRETSGPLNAVPILSGTAAEGRRRGWALGVAALLVAVAGAVLVLGGSRAEDAVLEAQGAEPRTRVLVAAVQAGAVALTGSVLGGIAGIGLPALAMASYNDGERLDRLSDIPIVVPASVPVLLVALPLAAAAVAALVVGFRPPTSAADVALLDA